MSPVIEVRDLRVQLGDVVAIDGFDLTASPGASIALIGRNGAGKSTTLKVLAGVLPPTSGAASPSGPRRGPSPPMLSGRTAPTRCGSAQRYC